MRVDRRSLPPLLARAKRVHRKVKMWRRGVRIPGRADESNHIPLLHSHALFQSRRITVEMRIVIAKRLRLIELINRVATGLARKELLNSAVSHCQNGRSPGSEDVDRFMRMPAVNLGEGVLNLRDF